MTAVLWFYLALAAGLAVVAFVFLVVGLCLALEALDDAAGEVSP